MELYHEGQRILRRSAFREFFSPKDKYTTAIELWVTAEGILRKESPALADSILVSIADTYTLIQNYHSAADHYVAAVGTQPGCYLKAAKAYELAGQSVLAAKAYECMAAHCHTEGDLWYAITYYYNASKLYSTDQPSAVKALLSAADTSVRFHQYPQALGMYSEALKATEKPERTDILPMMALCYIAMKDRVAVKRLLRVATIPSRQLDFLKSILRCVSQGGSVLAFDKILNEYHNCITDIMYIILSAIQERLIDCDDDLS